MEVLKSFHTFFGKNERFLLQYKKIVLKRIAKQRSVVQPGRTLRSGRRGR